MSVWKLELVQSAATRFPVGRNASPLLYRNYTVITLAVLSISFWAPVMVLLIILKTFCGQDQGFKVHQAPAQSLSSARESLLRVATSTEGTCRQGEGEGLFHSSPPPPPPAATCSPQRSAWLLCSQNFGGVLRPFWPVGLFLWCKYVQPG